MRKILLILLIIVLGLAVLLGVRSLGSNKQISNGQGQQPILKNISDYFSKQIPFNILLLGYAGGNHAGAYLTDSILVAHVDPLKKSIDLISVPRDLYVRIPTNGNEGSYWKINAAYVLGMDNKGYPKKDEAFKGKDGPGNLSKYVLSEVLGLSIDRFLAIDFNGFKKTIDTLGGVDVRVEKSFDDFEYPVEGKENDLCGKTEADLPELVKIATVSAVSAFPCRFEHLHFDSGVVAMDGATALKFVRSRHSAQDGSDFGRSQRQKNLLLGVKDKVLSLGFIPKIPSFALSLKGDFKTDLGPLDMAEFLKQASLLKDYQIRNFALTTENFLKARILPDGQYVLISREGQNLWGELHRGVQVYLDPKTRQSSPIVKIESAVPDLGRAEAVAGRLRSLGFIVLVSQPSPAQKKKDLEKTTITLNNLEIAQKKVREIQNELETGELVTKPTPDTTFDVLVTIGRDYLPKTIAP